MWLLLACSGDGLLPGGKGPPPENTAGRVATVGSSRASCDQYADVPEVLGVCLTQRVVSLATVAEVEAFCPAAGTWEGACRQAWVDEQRRLRRDFTPEELLGACGTNHDCTFQVLDNWPSRDVLEQIDRCERFARAYLSDCVGHALHRWTLARPTPEEGARVLAGAGPHAQRVGTYFGMSEGCGGTLTCPEGTDLVVRDCLSTAESYRRAPERCPTR